MEILDFRGAHSFLLREPGAQDLSGIVPLVERGVDVETLVALQPNELGVQQECQHFREFGLAAAGISLDKKRLAQLPAQEDCRGDCRIGDVTVALEAVLHGLDLGFHAIPQASADVNRSGEARNCSRHPPQQK